ncbi:MAG: hypothetical protein ACE5K0_03495 [Candidatus Methanofastidiosia archaeon]
MDVKRNYVKRYLLNHMKEKNLNSQKMDQALDFILESFTDDAIDEFISENNLDFELEFYRKRDLVKSYLSKLPKTDEGTIDILLDNIPKDALESIIKHNRLEEKEEEDTAKLQPRKLNASKIEDILGKGSEDEG